ncbi:MAG: dual specificity protein phosphatase family protein [Candidatus Bathyarchaeota archaeon]|nr:MAG: dual specificity protein phosphatase family protein [Candidatus Bathyarchaeota archaeon]
MSIVEIWDLVIGAILARLYKLLSLLRLHPNMNRVTENIWVGGANHPSFIVENGFDAVVDLRERDDGEYTSYLEKSGVEYLRRPTPDGSGMHPRDLLATVEWIAARAKRGEKVLIHCSLGRGRAALAASSYLVYSGLDPKAALGLVKEKRRVTYLNGHQKEAFGLFARFRGNAQKGKSHS